MAFLNGVEILAQSFTMNFFMVNIYKYLIKDSCDNQF